MNRFTKNERLHSRKQIEALFTGGEHFFVYPFKVIYGITNYELRITGDNEHHSSLITHHSSLLIAVPKRRIKKAVRRNLIKRRTREAWRLNKLRVTSYELRVTRSLKLITHHYRSFCSMWRTSRFLMNR